MSEFESAVTWPQNGEIQLLFFALGLNDDECFVTVIPESMQPCFQCFDYRSDGEYPVTLLEWRSREEFSLKRTTQLIEYVFSLLREKAHAVICMFDGAFLSSEDLFEEENAEQIFAHQFKGETRLSLGDELRHSDVWRDCVRRMQVDARDKYNSKK